MTERRAIGMFMLHEASERDQDARERLAAVLPPGSEVTAADDLGVFEVSLDAADQEDALLQVWNAIAASGTDDHLVFLEHPDLPEHWRTRSGAPASSD